MGTEFPWRWGRGTISANLDVIWGMSDQPILHDLLGHRRITLDPGHGYGPEANLERFKNLFGYAHHGGAFFLGARFY